MIKSDLVGAYGDRIRTFSFAKSRKLSIAIFDEITTTLACGKRIELRGFGTFSVKVREPALAVIPARRSQFQRRLAPDSRQGRK
jgi:nucleoid DNA-binding protein